MTELGKKVWDKMEEMGWENAPKGFYLEYYENIIECTKQALIIPVVAKSLPQDNYCKVCNLHTDGEKCYSKRCPIQWELIVQMFKLLQMKVESTKAEIKHESPNIANAMLAVAFFRSAYKTNKNGNNIQSKNNL